MKAQKIGGTSGLIIRKGDGERGTKECGMVETSRETKQSEILVITITAETNDHSLLLGGIINFVEVKSNPVWQN